MSDKRGSDEQSRPEKTLGVVIARFQVPSLHLGHSFLLDYVRERNEKVLVILGVSGGQPTQRDPFDWETRRLMIEQHYSAGNFTRTDDISVAKVRDVPDDVVWSQRVDDAIRMLYLNDYKVTLYGGPDSFIPHYLGKYETLRVEVPDSDTGTAMRLRYMPPGYPNTGGTTALPFREGMLWAANIRKPVSFQTVDIAILKGYPNISEVLMGEREGDDGLRFPGGFVDPTDESLEMAAKREAREETSGMGLDDFEYLGSFRINDWRYRDAPDKVMTALFVAYYMYGNIPDKGDDFEGGRWVPLDDVMPKVASIHRPLAKRVVEYAANINVMAASALRIGVKVEDIS